MFAPDVEEYVWFDWLTGPGFKAWNFNAKSFPEDLIANYQPYLLSGQVEIFTTLF